MSRYRRSRRYHLGAEDNLTTFSEQEQPKGNKAWLLLALLALGVGIFAFSRKAKAEKKGPLAPAPDVPPAENPPPPPAIDGVQYTIQSGDSLSSIAKAHYGNYRWWPVIFEANKQSAGGPLSCNWNLIFPGVTITLPPKQNYDETEVFSRPMLKNWKNPPATC